MQTLHGRAVLVVDDDADTLDLYATALAKLGATVQRAKSTDVAIAIMTAWRPDVVLCDLHLPGFDGYSLLEYVQADAGLRGLPVIAISGSHPQVERQRSLQVGFVDYFTKPTKLGDIVQALIAATSSRIAVHRE